MRAVQGRPEGLYALGPCLVNGANEMTVFAEDDICK